MSRRVPEEISSCTEANRYQDISIYLIVCNLVQSVYGKRSQEDDSHEAGEDTEAEGSLVVLTDPDLKP